ncbi:MAG TPA: hypothetical protein VMW41_00865 [Candidatus Bathyarchaeia archaeon]|nr:hypothetical protein [Candidatus Bathyarchaeia archaeon]
MKSLILKIKFLIKKYWIFILLLLIIGILVSITSRPKKETYQEVVPPSPTQEAEPTIIPFWQEFEPEKTSETEIKNKVGTPLKEYEKEGQKILEYPSDYEYYPNKIYLKDDKLQLVKELVSYQRNIKLESFIKKYGNPSLIMYEENLNQGYPINIFLDNGIAVAAHIADGSVLEIWYFKPMSRSDFIQTIGKSLTTRPVEKF